MMNIPGYKIEKEIGHGGMSTVYLAEQESLSRHVALKVMSPALAADRTFGERFMKEGRTVAQLNHPHIVAIHDIGVHEYCYYQAAEYIAGGDLKERIRRGQVDAAAALVITRQMADALGFAHAKGFVHRDVKPENIMFRDTGAAVLSDFGIARAMSGGTRMTATGTSIGTPHYMSPEQARGKEVDGRSDLYSLGVVLFEMLTGHVPYDSEDTIAIAYSHVNDPVPELPGDLRQYQALIDRLMAKEPGNRYQSAAALMAAIDKLQAGGSLARPSSATEVVSAVGAGGGRSKTAGGQGLKWALGGGLLALVLGVGLYFGLGYNHSVVEIGGGGGGLIAGPPPAAKAAAAAAPRAARPVRRAKVVSPPAVVPPSVQVQPAFKKGRAILSVGSTPPGAVVYLDGRRLGQTPYNGSDLPAGKFTLRLTKKYYQAAKAAIELANDQVLKKDFRLSRGQGLITVLSTPGGGRVYLDSRKETGRTPITLRGIAAGRHKVRVHIDRYYDAAREVEVLPGKTALLRVSLKGGDLVRYEGKWLTVQERKVRKEQEYETFLSKAKKAMVSGDLGVVSTYLDKAAGFKPDTVAEKTARRKLARLKEETNARSLQSGGRRLESQGGLANLQEALAKYESALGIWPGLPGLAAQISGVRDKIKKAAAATKLRRLAGEFVPVPGGCYQMGCGSWTDHCDDDESPVHKVCVDSFKIGKYEITQGEWQAVMGDNPSHFKKGDNYPVENVSWNDVQGYIKKLNQLTGRRFRLPTEAEWEYACRSGGKEEKYCGGSDIDSLAWYSDNSGGHTHSVGTKQANGLGIYDMTGNVWEWVRDWYGDSYYGSSPRNNPGGPLSGSSRVIRGGSWYYTARNARAAFRDYNSPGIRYFNLGFRLVLPSGQ